MDRSGWGVGKDRSFTHWIFYGERAAGVIIPSFGFVAE